MVHEKIKSFRKEQGLTQAQFAEKLGVSRNSIVRYENGTSPLTINFIDSVCQHFQVGYVEVIGADHILSPLENYNLSVKIETIKEVGAGVLARLHRYLRREGIDFANPMLPWGKILDELTDIVNDKIYDVETFEEADRYFGYIQGIENLVVAMEEVA